jgi:hypothetical protein
MRQAIRFAREFSLPAAKAEAEAGFARSPKYSCESENFCSPASTIFPGPSDGHGI